MKANKEIIKKTLASCFSQNDSIADALQQLLIYELILEKQYEELLDIIKESGDIKAVFLYLKFSKSFVEYTIFFNNYYSLSVSIDKAISLINEKESIKKEIIASLVYPAILIIMTSIALLFISSYIVPQLLLLSPDSNKEYFFIILILKYIPKIIFIVIIILISAISLIFYAIKHKFSFFMKKIFKLPLINRISKLVISLNFSLYLKEVIKDVPLNNDSIVILKNQSSDIFIEYICDVILVKLSDGTHLFEIIKEINMLNDDLKQTMYLAINSKKMSVLLNNYYEMKTNILKKKIKTFLTILIPIIVSFVGIILILMYLLIMMPILNMGAEI